MVRQSQSDALAARLAAAAAAQMPAHGPVLVAISGGLDSVVLLHVLRYRGGAPELVAAHFDHGMRPDSARDADWVRGVSRAWEVSLHEARSTVPLKGESAARAARYSFLRRVQRETGALRVFTAHHQDDQVETVLFRMLRGSGLAGLSGIPAERGPLRRPFLPFSREELADYARGAGLTWREDPTNDSLDYARNYLRHEVIPRLERASPGAALSIARLSAQAARDEEGWEWVLERLSAEAIQAQNHDWVELARPVILAYHPRVRGRLVRHLVRRFGSIPAEAGTRAALEFISTAKSGRVLDLVGGVRLEREFDTLRIRRLAPAEAAAELLIPAREPGAGLARLDGRAVRVSWGGEGSATAAAALDAGRLDFPLRVRGWHAGDRLRLASGSRKLKRLFVDRRIGRAERRRRVVLADAGGTILWVEGLGTAAGYAAESGREALHLVIEDVESEPELRQRSH